MPAPYPTPTANQTADLLTVTQFTNSAAGGILMPLILLGVWIIAFIGAVAEGRPASRAWIFSSFVTTILGILLVLVGMLNVTYVYFLVLNIAISIGWIYLSGSRND